MITTIKRGNREFAVSTVDTFDRGWETMVFEMFNGVINYRDLAAERYDNAGEAAAGHAAMVENFQPGPQHTDDY